MKKQYILIIMLVISMITGRAQSSYTTIEYNETIQPTHVLELPNNTDDVEGTILKKLKQIGYNPETKGSLFWKKNKKAGFYVFNNVTLPSLSNQKLDLYFKVVQKNKEEKSNSTLYLLVSTGNENFSSPTGDTVLWNSSKVFLDGFLEKTTAYSLEQKINSQENALIAAQKKLTNLQKDEKDLTEKIKKYENELLQNQNSQKNQQENIETQTKQLEALKLQRNG